MSAFFRFVDGFQEWEAEFAGSDRGRLPAVVSPVPKMAKPRLELSVVDAETGLAAMIWTKELAPSFDVSVLVRDVFSPIYSFRVTNEGGFYVPPR